MQERIEIKKIGIIGNGKMGTDLFNYFNEFEYKIVWKCSRKSNPERLKEKMIKKINRRISNQLINQQQGQSIKNSVIITNQLKPLEDCDLIIESISEDRTAKKELFQKLAGLVKTDCILATNSSSIIPSSLFRNTRQDENIIGLHFFYPLKLKKITELIVTSKTRANLKTGLKLFLSRQHFKVLDLEEKNGFILNKILLAFQNEAFSISREKNLDFREIDQIIKQHIMPAGVFEFFDQVGNDIILQSILAYTANNTDQEHFQPLIRFLTQLVAQNKLGLKTGQGFYEYSHNKDKNFYQKCDKIKEEKKKRDNDLKKIVIHLKIILINSFYHYLNQIAVSEQELDFFLCEYSGRTQSLIKIKNDLDSRFIHQYLIDLYQKTGNPFYSPAFDFNSQPD